MFDELIRTYKKLSDEIYALEQQKKDLRSEFSENVMAHGDYHSAEGNIEVRSSYFRVSYDANKVDAVLATLWEINPALATLLENARKMTTVQATWAVK